MANKGIGKAKHQSAAKRKKKKKKGGSPVHYMHTKPKGYTPMKRKRASSIVDNDLAVLLKGLNNDSSAVRRERDYGTRTAEDLLTRSKGDLGYIRGEVADAMGANNQKINQNYDSTKAKVAALTQALQGNLSETAGQNKAAMMDELSRLGIQQAATGRLDEDAANAQNVAAQTGSNEQANLGLAQGMSADIGNMLLSMNEGTYGANMGKAINTRNDTVSKISHSANEQLMDIMDQMGEARAGRAGSIAKLYEQMNDSRFNRWATTRDMNFNQQLQTNQFNQSEAQRRKDNALQAAAARQAAAYRKAAARSGGGSRGGQYGTGTATRATASGGGGAPVHHSSGGRNGGGHDFFGDLSKAIGGMVPWGHGKKKKTKKPKTRYTPGGKPAEWYR